MRRVKSTNTGAEMKVRRILHKAGFRYRLHRKDLPGKPDIVFPGKRKVIFVHGCFWHQHSGCHRADRPASNTDYWTKKLDRNIIRDQENQKALQQLEWGSLIIWECEMRDEKRLLEQLVTFLTVLPS